MSETTSERFFAMCADCGVLGGHEDTCPRLAGTSEAEAVDRANRMRMIRALTHTTCVSVGDGLYRCATDEEAEVMVTVVTEAAR